MMLTPTDISKILNVSSSHVSLLSKSFLTSEDDVTKIGKRAYFNPRITRKILESRGVDFNKKERVAFANNKGGTGKTSTSVNTALRLSGMGFKTLFIDADSQANATSHILGNSTEASHYTLIDVVNEKIEIKDAIIKVTETLDILPSSLKNSMLDLELTSRSGRFNSATYFTNLLENLDYDYIIWDLSPTITTSLYWILLSCTRIVTVTNLDEYAVQGAEMTVELVTDLRANHKDYNPDIRILINRFDERNKSLLHYLTRLNKLESKGANLFGSVIKTDSTIQKTQSNQSMLPHNSQSFNDLSDFIVEFCQIDSLMKH